MKPDQITALAREYGEYVAHNPILAPIMKSEKRRDICVRANANRAKDVIKWITDRYCLVEKSKAIQIYQAKQHILANQDVFGISTATEAAAQKRLMLCLFPEIAKEVEE